MNNIKPNAFICFNGHITPIPKSKVDTYDGKRCPVCNGEGYIGCFGVDFANGTDVTVAATSK